MNKSNLLIFLGCLFLLVSVYLVYQRLLPVAPTLASETVVSPSDPVFLNLPQLAKSLPVQPARIDNNRWQTTSRGVSHWVDSPRPGQPGNSVIYGHNWPNLLAGLSKLVPGDVFSVSFADSSHQNFIVVNTSIVSGSQTGILAPTTDSRLTIYTCTGLFDQDRFVVVAAPLH